jgi:RNA polymerase sigma factor (sigma-70 family)
MATERMNGVAKNVRAESATLGSEPKDAELLAHFLQTGDQESFARLVKRHGPLVQSVCARFLVDRRDIEDVFQATFIVLASRAGTIRKMDSIASWLYGVAMRLARKVQVRGSRRKQHEQRAAMGRRSEMLPPDAGWREVCSILYEELNQLPERQRAPLLLCYWEGLSQDEAAHQLGLPRGTLKRRLETGRNKLRDRLASRGLGLSALLLAVMLSERKLFAAMPAKLVGKTAHNAVAARVAGQATGGISGRAALLAGGVSLSTLGVRLKAVIGLLLVSGALTVPVYYALPAAVNAEETGLGSQTILRNAASPSSNKSQGAPAAGMMPLPPTQTAPGDLPVRQPSLKGLRPHGVM